MLMRASARTYIAVLAVSLVVGLPAHGAGEFPLQHAGNDVSNIASLQRGARNFVNFCMGCHSAQYVRYNRLAEDLGLSEDQVIDNLMFAAEKPQETRELFQKAYGMGANVGLLLPYSRLHESEADRLGLGTVVEL